MFNFFDPDWKSILVKSQAIKVAAFWGALVMLAGMWPNFFDLMPLWIFLLVGLLLGMSVAIARVLKQPGVE